MSLRPAEVRAVLSRSRGLSCSTWLLASFLGKLPRTGWGKEADPVPSGAGGKGSQLALRGAERGGGQDDVSAKSFQKFPRLGSIFALVLISCQEPPPSSLQSRSLLVLWSQFKLHLCGGTFSDPLANVVLLSPPPSPYFPIIFSLHITF